MNLQTGSMSWGNSTKSTQVGKNPVPVKSGQSERHTAGDLEGPTKSVSDIKITHCAVTPVNYFECLDR